MSENSMKNRKLLANNDILLGAENAEKQQKATLICMVCLIR